MTDRQWSRTLEENHCEILEHCLAKRATKSEWQAAELPAEEEKEWPSAFDCEWITLKSIYRNWLLSEWNKVFLVCETKQKLPKKFDTESLECNRFVITVSIITTSMITSNYLFKFGQFMRQVIVIEIRCTIAVWNSHQFTRLQSLKNSTFICSRWKIKFKIDLLWCFVFNFERIRDACKTE